MGGGGGATIHPQRLCLCSMGARGRIPLTLDVRGDCRHKLGCCRLQLCIPSAKVREFLFFGIGGGSLESRGDVELFQLRAKTALQLISIRRGAFIKRDKVLGSLGGGGELDVTLVVIVEEWVELGGGLGEVHFGSD